MAPTPGRGSPLGFLGEGLWESGRESGGDQRGAGRALEGVPTGGALFFFASGFCLAYGWDCWCWSGLGGLVLYLSLYLSMGRRLCAVLEWGC